MENKTLTVAKLPKSARRKMPRKRKGAAPQNKSMGAAPQNKVRS